MSCYEKNYTIKTNVKSKGGARYPYFFDNVLLISARAA